MVCLPHSQVKAVFNHILLPSTEGVTYILGRERWERMIVFYIKIHQPPQQHFHFYTRQEVCAERSKKDTATLWKINSSHEKIYICWSEHTYRSICVYVAESGSKVAREGGKKGQRIGTCRRIRMRKSSLSLMLMLKWNVKKHSNTQNSHILHTRHTYPRSLFR